MLLKITLLTFWLIFRGNSPAPYSVVKFRLWIYIENTSRGLTGFELGIDFNIGACMESSVNPGVPSIVGDISSTAFAGAFEECQNTQFVWISKYSMYYPGTPHYVNTVPYSETGNYIVTSCEEGNPKYPFLEVNQFGVNICPDTESSSWGALKSLFR